MSGRHSFRKLREKIERDPERQERMEEKRKAYDVLLNLAELRVAKGLTQAELAERLGVSQPNVSKLEAATARPHAGAIYLSTLGGYIAALGGHLEVRASSPSTPRTTSSPSAGDGLRSPTPGVETAEIFEEGSCINWLVAGDWIGLRFRSARPYSLHAPIKPG